MDGGQAANTESENKCGSTARLARITGSWDAVSQVLCWGRVGWQGPSASPSSIGVVRGLAEYTQRAAGNLHLVTNAKTHFI